jgi:hypothetical protein
MRRRASGAGRWVKGDWDVPYQEEAEAVEQAFRLVELFCETPCLMRRMRGG